MLLLGRRLKRSPHGADRACTLAGVKGLQTAN